jgi:hypothetical protein
MTSTELQAKHNERSNQRIENYKRIWKTIHTEIAKLSELPEEERILKMTTEIKKLIDESLQARREGCKPVKHLERGRKCTKCKGLVYITEWIDEETGLVDDFRCTCDSCKETYSYHDFMLRLEFVKTKSRS